MKLKQRWTTAVMAAVVVVLGLAVGIAAAANVPVPGPAHSGSPPNTTTTSVGTTPQIAIVHQGAALHYGATRDVAVASASGAIRGSYGLSVSFVAPTSALDDLPRDCRSFPADTQVLMADGTTTPIANVQVGDEVWATDPETGEAGGRTVTAVWPHQDWLVDFTVEGGSVTTTEDHHFWNVTDGSWQETQHIDAGGYVLTSKGERLEAGALDWSTLYFADAFDLTVDDLHTYFVVTAGGDVLVHNAGCGPLRGRAATDVTWAIPAAYRLRRYPSTATDSQRSLMGIDTSPQM